MSIEKSSVKNEWFMYIIRCSDNSLYTGISTDVRRRFEEHCLGSNKGAKYLKGKGPLELLFQTEIGNRSLATKCEMAFKKLSKTQKEKKVLNQFEMKIFIDEVKKKSR
jgi:putative endonuclease